MGIGQDILYARLMWLKSKRAHSAFSEISRYNFSSSKVAVNAQMSVSGQLFGYFRKTVGSKSIEANDSRF
jgi:hypothetical protein